MLTDKYYISCVKARPPSIYQSLHQLLKQIFTICPLLSLHFNMDWVKKAKAKVGELEHDLTKATEALGINKHEEDASSQRASVAPSSATASSIPAVNTPTSSAAPSVINMGAPSVKLPIAVRKSSKKPLKAFVLHERGYSDKIS